MRASMVMKPESSDSSDGELQADLDDDRGACSTEEFNAWSSSFCLADFADVRRACSTEK